MLSIQKIEEYLDRRQIRDKIERSYWIESIKMIYSSTSYTKISSDIELFEQFVQLKMMRDRAWEAWNKNPEKYVRIVTGICNDGKTPKVLVKENEHYKIWLDCNKQLERILKDLMLTPEQRVRL